MPSDKETALKLITSGASQIEVAEALGVHRNTIRNWINPEAYRKNLSHCRKWAKTNPWSKRATQEMRDKASAYQRHRYATNPKAKKTLARLMRKYRRTPQGKLGNIVRQITLGHAGRANVIYAEFMTAATGMTRDEFTALHSGEGWFDHVVPICAFDLTNPEHLVRCVHPSNVRLIPSLENMKKGKRGRDCDVMALPWIGTQDALDRAQALITRVLARLQRNYWRE